MKILITGASGLVGGELIPTLEAKGHEIFKVSRKVAKNDHEINWDAYEGFAEKEIEKLKGIDAVIHLAGENVGDSNWDEEKKRRIRKSRVEGTRTLVDALKKLENPPKIFISASAVGFYGNRGDEILTEESETGEGFFPEVCRAWEAEGDKAKDFGARVVHPRIGVVLSKDGGALGKMLTPFKFGVGGTIGSGEQWMSWIAIDDLVRIFHFALENENLTGAINATAPNPVNNEEFTDTLGNVLHRPTILPVPAFGIKLLFGEMGEKLLLEGCRVIPQKLLDAGFEFEHPKLEEAIRYVLNN
ncbi:MAG: TIGR01777 family oxidoreductase [Aridibacter sp.]